MFFRLKGEFDQLITLTEIEEMLPFERMTYMILIHQKIEERRIEQGQ
jgi:hypothetical protein